MKNYGEFESAPDLLKEPAKLLPEEIGKKRLERLERMQRDYEEDLTDEAKRLLKRSISATKKDLIGDVSVGGVPKTPFELLSRPDAEVPKDEAAAEVSRLERIKNQGVPGVMYANGIKLLRRVIALRKKQAG